ncbi:amino acid adenylation domain-containing protein [Nonomuraea sp. NN258]|uniref:amino acid adenylation domain-containing protein n=1 Tax=Nonomuraea antri TaxID=2730852 RepID=UPI001568B57A|nr:amino acid adenylation domain-containing protein [Nonomuraea antri]NRQ38558.1 amino acid adenylation domain-containing protein [Nonomuraea antri]
MSCAHHDVTKDFAGVVARHPGRPAIVHNGHPITYAELAGWVAETARRLGPDPGTVGVPAARSPATVAALLGVLAAGGAYLPLDPAHPQARRESMLTAAACSTVLTPPGLPERPPAPGLPERPPAPVAWDVPADRPAYVLFTSGSTGAPKPVVTPRRAIGIVTGALRALFGLTPADRVLQFASLNWDTCFEEILPTLTTGAALIIHDHAYAGAFHRLLRMLADQRVTVLNLPTAYWHELVRHLTDTGTTLPGCVRLVVIGGEAVRPARLADWRALPGTGAIRLLNTYGCTETTLITHAADLHGPRTIGPSTAGPSTAGPRTVGSHPGGPADGGGRAPIGRPLPHVGQLVSDEGELLVGGPALALGYLGLPAATAERFAELGGERWFRTGDRVSVSADGTLVHEGRLDHELKIRGIRVDPGEVEAQIAAHPRVGAVAVAGVTVADHTTLAAYIVPSAAAQAAQPAAAGVLVAEVRDFLRDRVPCHLVPARITVVPELVHTASGKVDRAASHRRYAGPSAPRHTPLKEETTS